MPREPRSIDLTVIHEWNDGAVRPLQDALVAEEPLEIRIDGTPLTVTMRTPGSDQELAAGFLFTEGFIQGREDIVRITDARSGQDAPGNLVEIELRPDCVPDRELMKRNFFTASSCGICGKASIEQVRARNLHSLSGDFQISADLICEFPERLRDAQKIFGYTGSLHAAGLFDQEGVLIASREDVGRHNAVDKIAGWALMTDRIPLSRSVMLVSGRGGFEIIQKAVILGIPILACVSAPSSLAVRLAREMNMTLVGFLRGKRFVVYSAPERILSSSQLIQKMQ